MSIAYQFFSDNEQKELYSCGQKCVTIFKYYVNLKKIASFHFIVVVSVKNLLQFWMLTCDVTCKKKKKTFDDWHTRRKKIGCHS